MSQQTSDYDATVVHLPEGGRHSAGDDLPFPAVAVASGSQAPRNAVYIAQQTSLEDFTPGLNPMVNAAAHLLLEVVRLREGKENDVETLRARLEAEVRGFEANALASELDNSHVLAARYVLCTALDEAVTTSKLGADGEWSRLALLSTFHNETWGGEKFFQILDRCMQQPARNLYLLELMYLLLSLGFEGRYRLLDRGPIALESLRDKIYRQVRLLRGEPRPDLAKALPSGGVRDKIYAYIPLWLIVAAVFFCLSATFWGFSFLLEQRAEPLLQQFAGHAPKSGVVALKVSAGNASGDSTDDDAVSDAEAVAESDNAESSSSPAPEAKESL